MGKHDHLKGRRIAETMLCAWAYKAWTGLTAGSPTSLKTLADRLFDAGYKRQMSTELYVIERIPVLAAAFCDEKFNSPLHEYIRESALPLLVSDSLIEGPESVMLVGREPFFETRLPTRQARWILPSGERVCAEFLMVQPQVRKEMVKNEEEHGAE